MGRNRCTLPGLSTLAAGLAGVPKIDPGQARAAHLQIEGSGSLERQGLCQAHAFQLSYLAGAIIALGGRLGWPVSAGEFRFEQVISSQRGRVAGEPGALLMSIPGVGPLVAACVVAQVGDIKRFEAPGKLCSYAGLVPRVHSSGQTHRSGAITKAGRRSLRWAMGVAAMSASRVDGPLKQ